MREIKFRYWDNESKQMINWQQVDELDRDGLVFLVDVLKGKDSNYSPMQYTGLKDKNGVDIYEGDIVTDNYAEYSPIDAMEYYPDNPCEINGVFEVCFGNYLNNHEGYGDIPEYEQCQHSLTGWYLQCNGYRKSLTGELFHSFGSWRSATNKIYLEVIGNIHQNPELLK